MAYQVLARKYRPQRFSDVVGQDHVTRTLLNALAQGRIAHGYVFSGHRGIGKTTIARIVAMALNCRTEIGADGADGNPARPTPEPCGFCESCTEIRAGNAVDVIEIDAATNRGIDEIRELRDAARYRPARDRYKIYILDEAHQITDAAFNALLKTLEEPPDHVLFMMATTQPEDIPQTIRSRCQHFSFHAVKFDDILTQLRTIALEEKVGADDEALALLAEAGDGSMRDALSIMDQAIASAPVVDGKAVLDAAQIRELMGSVPNSVFERLMEAIGEDQSAPVIEEINRLLNAGNSASQLARQFVRYLRNVLMARIAGERTELLQLSPDERARAGRSALLFSEEDLTRFLGVMLRTFDELNYRQEPRFHLELGLLKLVHLQRLLPVEQLLSQIGSTTASRLGGGPLPGTVQKTAPASWPGSGLGLSSALAASPATASSAAPSSAGSKPQQAPAHSGQSRVSPSMAPPPRAAGSVVGLAEAGRPASSPFEADSRRKGGEQPSALAPQPLASLGANEVTPRAPEPEQEPAPKPILKPPPRQADVSSEELAEIATAAVHLSEGTSELAESSSPASLNTAPQSLAKTESDEVADAAEDADGTAVRPLQKLAVAPIDNPVPALSDAGSHLDSINQHVCAALEQAGHNTAAALLRNGIWIEEESGHDAGILVKVGAKKTMLGLTINADAERICRETMRFLAGSGPPRTLSFVPGDGGSASSAARKALPPAGVAGSVRALAMDNPLVKQAQELFHAEVRSVVDLRNK